MIRFELQIKKEKEKMKSRTEKIGKTKQQMIKEIMLFRYSSKDANYIDPLNLSFIKYITNEYKKMKKEEIEIEYNFYLNRA